MTEAEKRVQKILAELKNRFELAKERGLQPIAALLYGSQNYGLDTPESDYDVLVVVMPSLREIALGTKPFSEVWHHEDGSQTDIKDIRLYFDLLKKQNVKYLETLFGYVYKEDSESPFKMLAKHRHAIAHHNIHLLVTCIKGMASEKLKALDHPYPSKLELIEKYGFDPKQLMHTVRLFYLIKKIAENPLGYDYATALRKMSPTEMEVLKAFRSGERTLEFLKEVNSTPKEYTQFTYNAIAALADKIRADFKNLPNPATAGLLDDCMVEIFEKYLR